MRAQPARHVITPLILLDRLPTLGTLLSVCHNPSNVLAFIRILSFPRPRVFAAARSVRLLPALEAEGVAALALHVADAVLLVFNAVVAALVRTPPHVLVVVRVRLAEPLLVCLLVVPFQVLLEERVRHCQVALVPGAGRADAFREACVDLGREILAPVLLTELVPATKLVGFDEEGVELGVAYLAVTFIELA